MSFSMASASPSPFLSLPTEIRLMIYRLLMRKKSSGNDLFITKEMCFSPGYGPQAKDPRIEWPQLSGQLLRVCRMVSHEATVVLYSENVFHTVEPYSLHEYFLPAIGVHKVALLKSVKIYIGIDALVDLLPSSDFVQSASFTRLAIQDVSVLFKKHIGLRSIQEFSLAIPAPSPLDSLHDKILTEALATLMRRGLRKTHFLEENIEIIGSGRLEATMKLVKLSPEVYET
jgi:hypothetical protein